MRIEQLLPTAFGPFTDLELDFSAPGLQVVYGPNEAGKSSALRALDAWLFGIPERTRDDFLHPRPALLVGGTLSSGEQRLTFFRRKKRKADIVDPQGNPIDPSLVTSLLGGLNRETFLALHGIDHDTLVRGGRDMLAHKGEIGQALFSAGAGLGALHEALAAMEEERDSLYRPRGKNQAINRGIRKYRDLERRIRECSCAPEAWQRQQDELEELDRQLAEATARRNRLEGERVRLERLLRAAPLLARRRHLLALQDALGPRLVLPDDFSVRRQAAQEQLREQTQRRDLARQRLAAIAEQEKGLTPDQNLLAQASRIDELVQQLGAIRKARQDRTRLEGMRSVRRREARAIIKQIMPGSSCDGAEPLLPLLGRRQRILALIREHDLLQEKQQDGERRLADLDRHEDELARAREALASVRISSSLAEAIRATDRAGEIDSDLARLVQARDVLRTRLQQGLVQAGFREEDVDGLPGLALPSLAAIRAAGRHRQELWHRAGELQSRIEELTRELQQVRGQLRALTLAGAPPSEEELARLRRERDTGWDLLLRRFLDHEEVESEAVSLCGDQPLHQWVEERIRITDQVSDRLRFEADRVHAQASLMAREEELDTVLQGLASEQQELKRQQEQWQVDWQALWEPLVITPDVPEVMEEWHQTMRELQQEARQLVEMDMEIDQLAARREHLRVALIRELEQGGAVVPQGDEVTAVLAAAESLATEQERAGRKLLELERDQQRLSRERKQLEQEVAEYEQRLRRWRQQWQETAILPGEDEPMRPEEAADILEQAREAHSLFSQAEEFDQRISGMERDRARFAQAVDAVARSCGEDVAESTPEEVVERLRKRLDRAARDQALHEQISRDRARVAAEMGEAESLMAAAGSDLAHLISLAGCQDEEELLQAEERSREQARLHDQLIELEQDLVQALSGMSREEAEQALSELDVDDLPGRIRALRERISTELDPAIRRLAEQRGEAAGMLARMDGSDAASRLAEEQAACLGALRRDADRFVRLQLAVDLLRREIEEYRRTNQGPVLALASDIFARLTLGSFAGLTTDIDNRGAPVLVGIRPGSNRPIEVAAMSTGSRDQLFFALRLASIRHRAEQGQPMVHIFDDVLINFDEERSRATLTEMARLARFSQLILFTHQARVAQQAASLDRVTVHDLAGLSAESAAVSLD